MQAWQRGVKVVDQETGDELDSDILVMSRC